MDKIRPIFDSLPFHNEEVRNMLYAGIGSREVPDDILSVMTRIASRLEELGYTLRSGGANGSDSAFERGVKDIKNKEIFYANDATEKSIEIAKEIHPNPNALSEYGMKLMGRNTFQIFGKDLDTPVDFVICYTKDGKEGYGEERPCGGTGQAVEMALKKGIPVINLGNDMARSLLRIKELIEKNDKE